MRVILSVLLVVTIAAAYALGGFRSGPAEPVQNSDTDLSTLASFRKSLELADVLERSYHFHGFLQTLGPSDIQGASEIIDARHAWLSSGELEGFMLSWASFDAPAALEWALSRSGEFRTKAGSAAIFAWAYWDPVAALEALESHKLGTISPELEVKFLRGWLWSENSDGVVEYVESQPERQKFTNMLTNALIRKGPDALIRWAEAVPEDAPQRYKRTAFHRAANTLAVNDPIVASRWVEKHLDHGYAELGPRTVGLRWLVVDPEAALDWLASLPRTGVTNSAMRITFGRWVGEAPMVAEAWAQSTAPDVGLDEAVKIMIDLNEDDPPVALDWAQRIFNEIEQAKTLLKLARVWLRSDPVPAEHWVAESELSESMKKQILKARQAAGNGKGEAAPPAPDLRSSTSRIAAEGLEVASRMTPR